jgi:hypothetical protein
VTVRFVDPFTDVVDAAALHELTLESDHNTVIGGDARGGRGSL